MYISHCRRILITYGFDVNVECDSFLCPGHVIESINKYIFIFILICIVSYTGIWMTVRVYGRQRTIENKI